MKARLGKLLPPGAGHAQLAGQLQLKLITTQFTISHPEPLQIFLAQTAAHMLVKSLGKLIKVFLRQSQSGRHGMTTKFGDQARVAAGHRLKGITHMQARNRTGRPFELTFACIGKGNHRPMVPLFQTRCQNTCHPLVPVRLVHAEAKRQIMHIQRLQLLLDILLHTLLDRLALAVELLQALRQRQRLCIAVGQQALNAYTHIIHAACRV